MNGRKLFLVDYLPRDRKERFHTRRGIRMRLPVISSGTEDGKVKFSKIHGILALRLSTIVLTSCYARLIVFLTRWSYHIGEMSAQETRNQQLWKIRRTTLAFGVVQILLGLSLTTLSFTAFVFTSSERIRNACPYWAGFTVSNCIFPLTVFSNLRVVITSWRDFNDKVVGFVLFFNRYFAAVVLGSLPGNIHLLCRWVYHEFSSSRNHFTLRFWTPINR